MAHIEGVCRHQGLLLPTTLDDFVASDAAVRVIDAYVDSRDLAGLGFARVTAEATGRPPFHPAALLKLYLYGYMNQVRSSRRLEREAGRNVEVMWLIGHLTPSFKTIADFRAQHPGAIVATCRSFIQFCRGQNLYGGRLLAIDGTKIEAVASRKKVLTPEKLRKQAEAIDRKIAEHLAAMDAADREDEDQAAPAGPEVTAALEALRRERAEVAGKAAHMDKHKLRQWVQGEPDARRMRTARHGAQVGYNAQTAVDGQHGLIAAFDLTNEGNDHRQLFPMAVQAKEALEAEAPTVVADAGYANGEQAQQCADAGITVAVPCAQVANPADEQLFTRDDFTYDPVNDTYGCPAGETLTRRDSPSDAGQARYTTKACRGCPLKPGCTKAGHRTITRGPHQAARDAMHQRTLDDPALMRSRRCLAEHPFGTMKWMLGQPRFLVRGLRKAKAELALIVLGYNLKRAIAIQGAATLLAALNQAPA